MSFHSLLAQSRSTIVKVALENLKRNWKREWKASGSIFLHKTMVRNTNKAQTYLIARKDTKVKLEAYYRSFFTEKSNQIPK